MPPRDLGQEIGGPSEHSKTDETRARRGPAAAHQSYAAPPSGRMTLDLMSPKPEKKIKKIFLLKKKFTLEHAFGEKRSYLPK